MLDNEKTILLARELAKALQASDVYKEFELARQANDEDEALQDAIGSFNVAQMNLEAEREKDSPDTGAIARYTEDMQNAYKAVMENPNMLRYQHSVDELSRLLTYVNGIISAGVNGEDPDAVTEEDVCTHDCSTCGGCH